jgi:hypothetical protein
MAEQPVTPNAVPAISARTRSIVYITCLAINVLAVLVFGLGVVFEMIDTIKAVAAGGVITGVLGMVASGLGVAYRPTDPNTIYGRK